MALETRKVSRVEGSKNDLDNPPRHPKSVIISIYYPRVSRVSSYFY